MNNISLAAMGSYTVGGRPLVVEGQASRKFSFSAGYAAQWDPNGHYWTDHAYVQYFVPVYQRFLTPVVFVHGGGLTGTCWEMTPDGREGWLQRFLRAGISVHVVDNVERGRAGYGVFGEVAAEQPIVRSDEEAWWLYRFGLAAGYAERNVFDGQQFPVENMEELARMNVPRRASAVQLQHAALREIVGRLGRCVLVGHSQGGGFVLETACARPGEVAGCVVLEPHGAFEDLQVANCARMPVLALMGDFIELSQTWLDLDRRTRETVERFNAAGASAQYRCLPDQGIRGNSHMLMMDRNSDQIADVVIDWLDRNVSAGAFR